MGSTSSSISFDRGIHPTRLENTSRISKSPTSPSTRNDKENMQQSPLTHISLGASHSFNRTDDRFIPLAPEISRGLSVNSTIGVPLSKVDIGEKEEGEISDEDESLNSPNQPGPSRISASPLSRQSQGTLGKRYPIRVEDPYGRAGTQAKLGNRPAPIPSHNAGPSRQNVSPIKRSVSPREVPASTRRDRKLSTSTNDPKALDDTSLAAPSGELLCARPS